MPYTTIPSPRMASDVTMSRRLQAAAAVPASGLAPLAADAEAKCCQRYGDLHNRLGISHHNPIIFRLHSTRKSSLTIIKPMKNLHMLETIDLEYPIINIPSI